MAMLYPILATIVALAVSSILPLHVVASVSHPAHLLVQVDVYMETLCPASAYFVKEQLPILFMNNISSIIDLSIVPWGNAHMTPDGPLCQHGPVECQMNRKMSCFNFYHTDQSLLLQYAACSEGHSALDIDSAANKCIKALGVDLGEIRDCEDGPLGDELQSQAFNDTAALEPSHKWVPWVVVNGQPLFDDLDYVQQYICTAYTGPRPEACSEDPKAPPNRSYQLMEQAASSESRRSFMHDMSTLPLGTMAPPEPCYVSEQPTVHNDDLNHL